MNVLEAFYVIKDCLQAYFTMENVPKLDFNLDIIEKGLKALEIIKQKQVDIKWFGDFPPSLQQTFALSEQEFDLLKEVFNYEF